MISESEIGKRIREYRKFKRMTLQEVADKSGFSKGYLSKVEKSEKAPPLSTLANIAKVLNVSISMLLGEAPQTTRFSFVKKNERALFAGNGSAFGYAYESIAHHYSDRHVEPFILTIPVEAENVLFQHDSEEMLFVLEGTMRFTYGEDVYLVEEGDCIYFDASVPHFGVAHGSRKVVCLIVMYNR